MSQPNRPLYQGIQTNFNAYKSLIHVIKNPNNDLILFGPFWYVKYTIKNMYLFNKCKQKVHMDLARKPESLEFCWTKISSTYKPCPVYLCELQKKNILCKSGV